MSAEINFSFNGHVAPQSLIDAMRAHGGKSLKKSMTLFGIEYANRVLESFKQIGFGQDPPLLSRDKRIVKNGCVGWLVFAGSNGDEYLALDFNPGPTGTVGQVIWFYFEDNRFKWIADSFEKYWEGAGLD